MKILNNKRIWLVTGLTIILIWLVILVFVNEKSSPTPVVSQPLNNQPATTENSVIPSTPIATTSDKFRSEVPTNIKVPDENTVLTEAQKKEIAVPTVVTEAAPGATSKFRSFNISGEGGKFIPSKIIANVGDTVHVNFTAVDKAYDIVFPSYNMKQSATIGQTKILEFQALIDGSFLYYCESCGGAGGPTQGNIIIVK
jgi:plastocyanin